MGAPLFRPLSFVAFAATLLPAHLQAAEPLVLQPSSDWQMSYDEDSCRLARKFGSGADASVFYMERFAPEDAFQMVVAGKPFKGLDRRSKVTYQFGAEQPRRDASPLVGKLGELDPSLVFSSAQFTDDPERSERSSRQNQAKVESPLLTPAQEAAITWASFGSRKDDVVRLELGSMGKPMEAMRTCISELLTHWGIDVAAHETLSQRPYPVGNPGTWITYSDYPVEMLEKDMPGLVMFRMMVDARGKATSCHVQRSTRPQAFDDVVCTKLMQNARFKPALDANGEPIASYWRSSVRFEI